MHEMGWECHDLNWRLLDYASVKRVFTQLGVNARQDEAISETPIN